MDNNPTPTLKPARPVLLSEFLRSLVFLGLVLAALAMLLQIPPY